MFDRYISTITCEEYYHTDERQLWDELLSWAEQHPSEWGE